MARSKATANTNRASNRRSTSRQQTSRATDSIILDDNQTVPSNSVASLQSEVSLNNDAISLARKQQQKAEARRDEEQRALTNKHATERKREADRLDSLYETQKELEARLSQVLQSSTSSQSNARPQPNARSQSTAGPQKNVSKAKNSTKRTKLGSGLTATTSGSTTGTQIATPDVSHTSSPLRQSWSSFELEETTPNRQTKTVVKANGRPDNSGKVENRTDGIDGHPFSRRPGPLTLAEARSLSTAELLKAFGAHTGNGRPLKPVEPVENRAPDVSASKDASTVKVKTEAPESDDGFEIIKSQPVGNRRAQNASRSSPVKLKTEQHESDGSFDIIQLSDDDETPSALQNSSESTTLSRTTSGTSRLSSSNDLQFTGPARNAKRERVDDDEVPVAPSPKRTQRETRGTTAANGRRVKMEDGELVCWPVRMPPYISQLTDFSLKQQFPTTNYKFSREFLTKWIGGNAYETMPTVGQKRRSDQIYDVKEYGCWSPIWNPHIPPRRGVHGASLSIDVWDGKTERMHRKQRVTLQDGTEAQNANLQNPVQTFCKRRELEYEYVGLYSQGRHFERLTNEEYETEVPEKTRVEWAKNVIVKEWGAKVLIDGGICKSRAEAQGMTVAQIRELMDRPDDHPGPKLRFYWRYLEFHEYDGNFYDTLAAKGREVGFTTKANNGPWQFGHPTRFEVEEAEAENETMAMEAENETMTTEVENTTMPTEAAEVPGSQSTTNPAPNNERPSVTDPETDLPIFKMEEDEDTDALYGPD
ncbi:MAG: hypothetical protein M1816_000098 [Peltula sp. TS41687]|nr:MAG: hypothetical protein M1816_000098 [Peltula sp. TS41687]